MASLGNCLTGCKLSKVTAQVDAYKAIIVEVYYTCSTINNVICNNLGTSYVESVLIYITCYIALLTMTL